MTRPYFEGRILVLVGPSRTAAHFKNAYLNGSFLVHPDSPNRIRKKSIIRDTFASRMCLSRFVSNPECYWRVGTSLVSSQRVEFLKSDLFEFYGRRGFGTQQDLFRVALLSIAPSIQDPFALTLPKMRRLGHV